MSIRSRPMRPKDVRGCVEIIEAHPIVGPRYSGVISHLSAAWLQYLGSEAFFGRVFEDVNGSRVKLVGAGARAFVSDDFLREVKTPPSFWVGPEMARRVACGNSPLLSDKEVRDANFSGGLNLLVWEGCMRMEDSNRPELHHEVAASFMADHRGFLIKEWITQAATLDVLHVIMNAGGSPLNLGNAHYADIPEKDLPELFRQPHVIGLTREMALGRMGSWVSNIFIYDPPYLGFRPGEQRLLLAALDGGTDEELANQLAVSRSAVKKTWSFIYERVAARAPKLIPETTPGEKLNGERGKEKKHRLLAYLREHLQELRPVSRRPLRSCDAHYRNRLDGSYPAQSAIDAPAFQTPNALKNRRRRKATNSRAEE